MPFSLEFTLAEILSILGLVQSVYVLVYMLLRSGALAYAVIPALYFTLLSCAFLFDAAAARWDRLFDHYEIYQWLFWFSGVPAGLLLMLQVAQADRRPKAKYFLLLLLVPISFLPGYLLGEPDILYVSGLVIGAMGLLAVWLRRDLLDGLHGGARFGEERFWLILSLIAVNAAFLASTLAFVSHWLTRPEWGIVRTLLGIAFVYIAATSLFRIYPQAVRLKREEDAAPTTGDLHLLDRLKALLDGEKIYQDAAIGRAELARELNTGEATLSKIVNNHYGKTIPRLLSELRVQDAQKLLRDTDAPVQTVYEESGFSSITTFNRVFKELSGESPKEYRARHRQP